MTLALGIDPGTATTGFGLVRLSPEGNLESVAHGAIVTPPHTPAHARLLLLHQDLCELIAQYHPDTFAVEKLFFQRNVSTAMAVGQARGIVLLAIAQARGDVSEYTPTEVKLAVAGYGSAEKHQVQEMVRTLLDLPEIPKPDDAADALAVAITHLHTQRFESLARDRTGPV